MNKNYIKITVILIVIMTIYSIAIYAIASNRNSKKKEKEEQNVPNENVNPPKEETKEEEEIIGDYNIILSPNTILAYKNGEWKENSKLKYTNMLFDVYINNEFKGKNYLSYSDDWRIYDEYKNFVDYEGKLLAVNTSLEYKNISFMTSEVLDSDRSIITSLLNEKGITTNYNELKKSKIIFDVNRDGIRDNIYIISNSFEDNNSSNKAFSIGFVNDLNKNEIFFEEIKDIDDIYKISNPYLQNILEINGQVYLIIGSEYFSNNGTEHHIYELKNNKIKEVLKTKANQ